MKIIPRKIKTRLQKGGKLLIYGRRKTGKSFAVKNWYPWERYFFVERGGTVSDENGRTMSYNEFITVFPELQGRKVVVDEFHRLPPRFLDVLQATEDKFENICLVTSAFHFAQEIIGKNSPILGLFLPIRVDIPSAAELIVATEDVEKAAYLREVWMYSPIRDFPSDYLRALELIPALISEIFAEEERKITNIYEGILGAVAVGKNSISRIASYLSGKGVLSRPNPTTISSHLFALVRMGILQRIPVWGKKRKTVYEHTSPPVSLYYYLRERVGFPDTGAERARRIIKEMKGKLVERLVRDLLAEVYGYSPAKCYDPEVDILLWDGKRTRIVGEVKWKQKLSRSELQHIERKLYQFEGKKILVVPDSAKIGGTSLQVIREHDLVALAHRAFY